VLGFRRRQIVVSGRSERPKSTFWRRNSGATGGATGGATCGARCAASLYGRGVNVTRLRQLVVVASDRDATSHAIRSFLQLGDPFDDPGVGEFGLRNAVFAVGDTFLEVVAPVIGGTTAQRHMDRHGGDAGYMVIFQVEDIEATRNHMRANDVRMVWDINLPEVGSAHVHPSDVGAAIVSFDEPRPAGSWLWGGQGWAERSSTAVASGLAGVTIAAVDPAALADRWAILLGVALADGVIVLPDGSAIHFVDAAGGPTGPIGFDLRASDPARVGDETIIANVRFRLVA
jgi:hypothetical protein